jgi:hypothetical protein
MEPPDGGYWAVDEVQCRWRAGRARTLDHAYHSQGRGASPAAQRAGQVSLGATTSTLMRSGSSQYMA